jgi:hypothetical protein
MGIRDRSVSARSPWQNGYAERLPDDKNRRAIVPGNLRKSELYKSIISTDPDHKMPPKEAHKTLSTVRSR